MDFVERRFDDLALHGKPIPDLDDERPEGWWAASFVAKDKAMQRLHELVAELPRRKGVAMLDDDHDALCRSLIELNAEIDAVNESVEPTDRMDRIDIDAEMAAWRERRRQRRWGHYLGR